MFCNINVTCSTLIFYSFEGIKDLGVCCIMFGRVVYELVWLWVGKRFRFFYYIKKVYRVCFVRSKILRNWKMVEGDNLKR